VTPVDDGIPVPDRVELIDRLEPPPAGARFAVTNVIGGRRVDQPAGYAELTDARAVLWIADGDGHRHFWIGYHTSDVRPRADPDAFTFRVRQARLGFEAGWTVSIVWGSCTYSTNHDDPFGEQPFVETPRVVELAVLDGDGIIGDGEPLSYVGPDLALAVIDVVSSMPTGHPTAAELIEACR
jgi:hypothetical protein